MRRRIGIGPARRILTSGGAVGGEGALRLGLADTLVPGDEVMATAVERARAAEGEPAGGYAAAEIGDGPRNAPEVGDVAGRRRRRPWTPRPG